MGCGGGQVSRAERSSLSRQRERRHRALDSGPRARERGESLPCRERALSPACRSLAKSIVDAGQSGTTQTTMRFLVVWLVESASRLDVDEPAPVPAAPSANLARALLVVLANDATRLGSSPPRQRKRRWLRTAPNRGGIGKRSDNRAGHAATRQPDAYNGATDSSVRIGDPEKVAVLIFPATPASDGFDEFGPWETRCRCRLGNPFDRTTTSRPKPTKCEDAAQRAGPGGSHQVRAHWVHVRYCPS